MVKTEALQALLAQFKYKAAAPGRDHGSTNSAKPEVLAEDGEQDIDDEDDDDDDDNGPNKMVRRYGDAVKKLPAALRPIAMYLMRSDEKGQPLPSPWRASEAEKKLLTSLEQKIPAQLDKLSAADRQKFFSIFAPKLSSAIEGGWQWMKTQPYTLGYSRKAFRAPSHPAATLKRRWDWLQQLVGELVDYKSDCLTPSWLAVWAKPAFDYNEDVATPIIVSVLSSKGKEADELFEILRQTVTREHPQAVMSNMTIACLLSSDRPAGWELMEKTLLAAQRQEGLRQWITQNVDCAHPEAFVRMMRLILDKDLLRFSSVARSVNIWLGLLWDSVSTKVLSENVEGVLKFVESPKDRKAALASSDPETVYRALWAYAAEDAPATIPLAKKLLDHKADEIRFVAVWILTQIGLEEAGQVKLKMLDDPNLQVAMMAAVATQGLSLNAEMAEALSDDSEDEQSQSSSAKARFEALERLYQRLPEKPQTLKAIVWPWTERKIERTMIAGCLLEALGDLPPTRMLPYLKGLSSWQQNAVIRLLAAQKKWDTLTRSTLFDLLGHASGDVRGAAYDALKTQQLKDDEWQKVESYLSRTAADLRKSCLELISAAKDSQVLASAQRLLSAGDRNTRLAGLELCRQLAVGNRCRAQVKQMAENYRSSQKKLVAEEETQLKAIGDSDREVLTLENGLGLFSSTGLTPVVPPKAKKVPLITKSAIACIQSLDEFIHEHQKTPVRVKNYRGYEDKLLGNLSSWDLPRIYPHQPLKQQLAKFPLIELWQQWLSKRPAKCKDKDGLELLRAFLIADQLDSWQFDHAKKMDEVEAAPCAGCHAGHW